MVVSGAEVLWVVVSAILEVVVFAWNFGSGFLTSCLERASFFSL